MGIPCCVCVGIKIFVKIIFLTYRPEDTMLIDMDMYNTMYWGLAFKVHVSSFRQTMPFLSHFG
jgi:hypothetical protein